MVGRSSLETRSTTVTRYWRGVVGSGFAELDSSGELGVVRSSVENSEVDGAGLIMVSVAFGLAGGSGVGSPSGGLEMG
jgi:hypothetical protein